MICTHDISEFGFRELEIAGKLLSALKTKKDLTKIFDYDKVNLMFNKSSGYVFLTNSEHQVAMLGDKDYLIDYLSCLDCGKELNSIDFMDEYNDSSSDLTSCCLEMLEDYQASCN